MSINSDLVWVWLKQVGIDESDRLFLFGGIYSDVRLRVVSRNMPICSDMRSITVTVTTDGKVASFSPPSFVLPLQSFSAPWVMAASAFPINYKAIISLDGSDIVTNNSDIQISDSVTLTAPSTPGSHTIQLHTISNNTGNYSDVKIKTLDVGGVPIALSDVKTTPVIVVPCQPIQISWRIAPAVLPPNHTATITSSFFSFVANYTSDFVSVSAIAPTVSSDYPITIKVVRTGLPTFSDQKTINLKVDTFLLSDVTVVPANPAPNQPCTISWRVITNALPASYVLRLPVVFSIYRQLSLTNPLALFPSQPHQRQIHTPLR